ncbi:MAG: hypothetical protein H6661_07840 [Ardenticatenaceae bacterium]|nr:hypothetical protein [Ardenticatenaceae bacterium]
MAASCAGHSAATTVTDSSGLSAFGLSMVDAPTAVSPQSLQVSTNITVFCPDSFIHPPLLDWRLVCAPPLNLWLFNQKVSPAQFLAELCIDPFCRSPDNPN